MTEIKKMRKFNVASLEGTYYDYGQFTIFVRRKVENSDLDWDVPISPKQGRLFVINDDVQKRAVQAIQSLFAESEIVYFYTTLSLEGSDDLKWEGNILSESQIFDRLQEVLESGAKVPEIVLWVRKPFFQNWPGTLEAVTEKLTDVCVPDVRVLKIETVSLP